MRIACLDDQPVAVVDDRAYRLTRLIPDADRHLSGGERMLALIRAWPEVAAAVDLDRLPWIDPAAAAWSAPVPHPGKILGAPVNYVAHGRELQLEHTVERLGVFLKAPSAVIGPGADIALPSADRRTDQEGELAVVIGRRARGLTPGEALEAVFGYTCLLDISVRGPEERSLRKSFDTFAPMGPWIVTPDEVGDPGHLRLRCWVNDELRQDASTADLVMSVPRLVSYASQVMTLEPGDVITTGTPAGVGPLAPGDRVAVEVERVGRLEVGVVAGPTWSSGLLPPTDVVER